MAIDRPFDPALLKKAGQLARRYRVVIQPHERLGFLGSGLEIPTVFADGKTPAECVESTYRALTVAVATMLESNARPPAPSIERKRLEQMNVRLTAEEKIQLKEASDQRGFRTIADYVRAVALSNAKKSA